MKNEHQLILSLLMKSRIIEIIPQEHQMVLLSNYINYVEYTQDYSSNHTIQNLKTNTINKNKIKLKPLKHIHGRKKILAQK
jgi:hypothetical protein